MCLCDLATSASCTINSMYIGKGRMVRANWLIWNERVLATILRCWLPRFDAAAIRALCTCRHQEPHSWPSENNSNPDFKTRAEHSALMHIYTRGYIYTSKYMGGNHLRMRAD